MEKFTSQIIRGGSWLTPYGIIIDDTHVRLEKRTNWLLNKAETSIPLDKISCTKIKPSIIGTDIIIESFGEGVIIAKNFSIEDARRMKELIDTFSSYNFYLKK